MIFGNCRKKSECDSDAGKCKNDLCFEFEKNKCFKCAGNMTRDKNNGCTLCLKGYLKDDKDICQPCSNFDNVRLSKNGECLKIAKCDNTAG